MTHLHRRTFLKGVLGTALVALTSGIGFIRRALAAEWPKDAFAAKSVEDALKSLYGSAQTTASGSIKIKAPLQAENGAVVPISASTTLPNVQSMAILVDKNPQPLVAQVSLLGTDGYFSARIKMGATSDVHCVVKSGGKLYSAKQNIKVTVGGCGG